MAINPIGEPIPRGTVTSGAFEPGAAAPAENVMDHDHAWHDLAAAGWNWAFVPALAWSSILSASAGAWQEWFGQTIAGYTQATPSMQADHVSAASR